MALIRANTSGGGGIDISDLIGVQYRVFASTNYFAVFTVGMKKVSMTAGQGSVSVYADSSGSTQLASISSNKTAEIDVEQYDVIFIRSSGGYTHYITVLE